MAAQHRLPPPLAEASGQATVELVAILPLAAALLALGWQAVIAGHAAWAATAAARAAARTAAVGGDAERTARARLPRALEHGMRVREGDGSVEVSVRVPAIVPGIRLGRVSGTGAFRRQEGG